MAGTKHHTSLPPSAANNPSSHVSQFGLCLHCTESVHLVTGVYFCVSSSLRRVSVTLISLFSHSFTLYICMAYIHVCVHVLSIHLHVGCVYVCMYVVLGHSPLA